MWSHLTYITAHVETQNTSAGACFCKTLKGETEISKNKTDLYWFMKLDSLLFCTEVCVLSDKHLKDNCTILYMWRKKHLSWGWCQRGGHVVTQRCLHLPFKTRAIYFRSSLCFIYKALKCHHMKMKIIRYLWLSQISNKQGQSFLSVWLKWLADLPTYSLHSTSWFSWFPPGVTIHPIYALRTSLIHKVVTLTGRFQARTLV